LQKPFALAIEDKDIKDNGYSRTLKLTKEGIVCQEEKFTNSFFHLSEQDPLPAQLR
jgi:hypothetical protein